MVEIVAGRAEIEADLLARIGHVKHMQHHRDNVRWVEAHAELDALLTEWQHTDGQPPAPHA